MKLIIFAAVSFLFLTSTALAKPVNTGWLGSKAIKGYDSVAYFKVNKAVKGLSEFSHTWNKATWLFSSKENLDAFKASPEKYAPQYGGYCAYAMATGKKVGISPEAFDIRDGKLYLNYNKKIQGTWKSEASSYIQKADTAWKGL